jgi:hypothetical protein
MSMGPLIGPAVMATPTVSSIASILIDPATIRRIAAYRLMK